MYIGPNFSKSSAKIVILSLSDYSLPCGHEVVFICDVNLLFFFFAFSLWLMMLSIFSCADWLLVYLFSRNAYSVPLPIFKLGYLSLIVEF
jgi:hypothetical protein